MDGTKAPQRMALKESKGWVAPRYHKGWHRGTAKDGNEEKHRMDGTKAPQAMAKGYSKGWHWGTTKNHTEAQ
eukprot:1157898-Pelagomonas_calceolata.AAC.3